MDDVFCLSGETACSMTVSGNPSFITFDTTTRTVKCYTTNNDHVEIYTITIDGFLNGNAIQSQFTLEVFWHNCRESIESI